MSDFSRLLPALVAALRDDPFYHAITVDFAGEPSRRDDVLAEYFRCSFEEAGRIGRVVLAIPPDRGGAAWLLPLPEDRARTEFAAKLQRLRRVLGAAGLENYRRIVEFMSSRSSHAVPADAWYLSIVGVAKELQGQGIGARLVAPTMNDARSQGRPCYLETFEPRNIRFYERLGFASVATHTEPTTNHAYVIMLRAATRS